MMKRKKNIDKVEVLTKATNAAIGIVKQMLDDLQQIDETIAIEQAENANKIAQIQADNEALDKLKEDNEKIISNFGALLGSKDV